MIAEMTAGGDYTTGVQNPLQWGRDQMIAEMLAGVDFVISTNVLQWGRDQMIAEIYAACRAGADLNWLQWGRDQMIAEIAPLYPISFQRSAARFASGWAVATGTIQCLATSCHQTPGIQSPYMLRAAPGLSPPPHRSRAKSCRGEKFHLAAF